MPGSDYSRKPWFGSGQNKCGSDTPDDTKRYAKISSCFSVRDFRQRGRSSFRALVVSGVWGGGLGETAFLSANPFAVMYTGSPNGLGKSRFQEACGKGKYW
jgi:hypothetical protein